MSLIDFLSPAPLQDTLLFTHSSHSSLKAALTQPVLLTNRSCRRHSVAVRQDGYHRDNECGKWRERYRENRYFAPAKACLEPGALSMLQRYNPQVLPPLLRRDPECAA